MGGTFEKESAKSPSSRSPSQRVFDCVVMEVSFDYEDKGSSPWGRIYRPIAKISFRYKNGQVALVAMVVDTGADYSILPKMVADRLGISLSKDCLKSTTAGVGGQEKIYFLKTKIEVDLGGIKKLVPVAFFDSDDVPPLLGRLGFLELFDTTFSKKHKVIFIE